jgi:hypothetical protein
MDFTHIVLTRFNVATGYAPSMKGIDSDWLEERLALFGKYCLPTVSGQKKATFRWIVFCNVLSPSWFKQRMAEYEHIFTTIYIDGLATDEVLTQKVRDSGLVTTPYLITTRIDNDDAIARTHLSMVQAEFRYQTREFISFARGLQLFRGSLYETYRSNSPFLSLIEKVADDGTFTTVFCINHALVKKVGKVRVLWRSPQWMQVLHGNNVGNVLRGWPKLRSASHPNFDCDLTSPASHDGIAKRWMFSLDFIRARAWGVIENLR